MGWFTRRYKLWRNQLASPPLTTRSCSELSSRRSSDDKLAVPKQIAILCFLSLRADKIDTTHRRIRREIIASDIRQKIIAYYLFLTSWCCFRTKINREIRW